MTATAQVSTLSDQMPCDLGSRKRTGGRCDPRQLRLGCQAASRNGLGGYHRPFGATLSTAASRFAVVSLRVARHALIWSGAVRAKNARRFR